LWQIIYHVVMCNGWNLVGGDVSFRQSAATEFLVKQTSKHAQFNEHMATPTWALSVSDDRKGILKTEKTTTSSSVAVGRTVPLPKENKKTNR
jgi:hypothetical protein